MPFRTNDERTTVHFMVPTWMPLSVYEACVKTGTPSNTRYMQEAICRRLADDMGLDYDDLLGQLPRTRNMGKEFYAHRHTGPANTVEEVR